MTAAAMQWMRRAACRRIPDLPWTAEPDTAPVVLGELMADVCAACPVRSECAAFVAGEDITAGYWAGVDRGDPFAEIVWLTVPGSRWTQAVIPLGGAA